MKVIAQESNRVTILFPLEEVLPLEGLNGPDVIVGVQQRYGFLKVPDAAMTKEEASKNGYKFGTGHYLLKEKKNGILEFAVYSDGIVAEAKNSEIGEAFLDDAIKFFQSEFGFRKFITKPRTYFYNQMVAEFEKPLKKLISSFDGISGAIAKYAEIELPIEFARLDIQVDNLGVKGPAPKFILERRANAAFELERYYSSAPLRSEDHVAVLKNIEDVLS